jgi:hypothetical protein
MSAGWRAGTPGEQRVRIIFDQPERIRKMTLQFIEAACQRTQEFVLTWSVDEATPAQIIVRQQWTFSPRGCTKESETYHVELDNVRVLELMIKPDLSDTKAVASLTQWLIYGRK